MTETLTGPTPKLEGRHVVLTGAAGNIGGYITRELLREGANITITGRNAERLDNLMQSVAKEGFDPARLYPVTGDCALPEVCAEICERAVGHFGPIHVLVNNAGGAGPKQTLENIPFTDRDKKNLGEDETMFEAAMNLLGGPWNMVRAALPGLASGASVINISTIFSRTEYFGRIAYVAPKSGLNALSLGLARELGTGPQAIRVNTIFPGPIRSERIDTVFAAMDDLQSLPAGSTSAHFRGLMLHQRPDDDGNLDFRYPTPQDVASSISFLASDAGRGLAGHAVEVTNGMQVPAQSRFKLVSWPDNRLADLTGQLVLVLGGGDTDEALAFAHSQHNFGAQVVVGLRSLEAVGQARAALDNHPGIQLQHLNPLRTESVERVFDLIGDQYGRLDGVIILPTTPNGQHGYTLSTASSDDVLGFVENELVAPVAFAAALSRQARQWPEQKDAPVVTYVTNPDDGRGNRLNEIKRASVEALIRVWRAEQQFHMQGGDQPWAIAANQLVRYDNSEGDNLAFATDWAITLNNRVRRMDAINLWIPKSVRRATGKSAMPISLQRVLPGLHHGRTAVITGGSLGIGLQLGRFLALAGARVLLTARSQNKLDAAREALIEELRGVGYASPEDRVQVLADIDVGDPAALERLFDETMRLFGGADFLINNAGIAGAEEMVVDMSLEDWNRTMDANLISNFDLIRRFAPVMKSRGRGSVLNVSSYFGGEKYLAVAYPNRGDYAVSKAGQRVLAEILSRHLGPEIQINAMAPGPVDGSRLRGLEGAPGLFTRRGRLILENIRMNRVHEALLKCPAAELEAVLERLSANRLESLLQWHEAPEPMKRMFAQTQESASDAPAGRYLLNRLMARKLADRLTAADLVDEERAEAFVAGVEAPEGDFFPQEAVDKAAKKIEAGIINRLHLHKMPTDEQVAISTVFSLADQIVSGETFHPSGGLKFDRSVTEGEMMLPAGADRLNELAGRNVVIFGEVMVDEIIAIARGYAQHRVQSITALVKTDKAAAALTNLEFPASPGFTLNVELIGDDLEAGLKKVREEVGKIHIVVSTPPGRLPLKPLAAAAGESWDRVLTTEDFSNVVRDHLTHHFRVARQAALITHCQIVLLTAATSRASTREEFALALFAKNALHALTVTLGVESERLATAPAVNQVQLTRRARTEEPANDRELEEEMRRMVDAVLLCSVPAPGPDSSRYLSRIFRGNAVTV
ncbi:MAG: SDR family oxidoreductase [Pseudomonadota bacterium]